MAMRPLGDHYVNNFYGNILFQVQKGLRRQRQGLEIPGSDFKRPIPASTDRKTESFLHPPPDPFAAQAERTDLAVKLPGCQGTRQTPQTSPGLSSVHFPRFKYIRPVEIMKLRQTSGYCSPAVYQGVLVVNTEDLGRSL